MATKDPRDSYIDFYSVRLLLSQTGWRPAQYETDLTIYCDAQEVSLTYTPGVDAHWTIATLSPWGEAAAQMKVIVPANQPYGVVTHMAEHIRSLAGLVSRAA